MNKTWMLFAGLSLVLVMATGCAWFQKKTGNRIAQFFGNGIAEYAECSEPKKVVKWAQGICSSMGICTEPTGPLSGALLKPLIDKFVPEGVDWIAPDAWGYCKLSKPKAGLKGFLYGLVDMLPVDLKQ